MAASMGSRKDRSGMLTGAVGREPDNSQGLQARLSGEVGSLGLTKRGEGQGQSGGKGVQTAGHRSILGGGGLSRRFVR